MPRFSAHLVCWCTTIYEWCPFYFISFHPRPSNILSPPMDGSKTYTLLIPNWKAADKEQWNKKKSSQVHSTNIRTSLSYLFTESGNLSDYRSFWHGIAPSATLSTYSHSEQRPLSSHYCIISWVLIFELYLHFDLNHTAVKFHHWVLHGCEATERGHEQWWIWKCVTVIHKYVRTEVRVDPKRRTQISEKTNFNPKWVWVHR